MSCISVSSEVGLGGSDESCLEVCFGLSISLVNGGITVEEILLHFHESSKSKIRTHPFCQEESNDR
jgi:hypothetical protein